MDMERLMRNGTPYKIHLCAEHHAQCGSGSLKDQIVNAVGNMSGQSRHQRFAAPITRLTDSQLEYLTNLNGTDRVAWCAYIPADTGDIGIALARYVKLEDEENVAEFAVTVVDEFQGQGIGTELLNKLIGTARSNSIAILRGYVLPHNEAMLALCRRLDAHTMREDASTIRADIRI